MYFVIVIHNGPLVLPQMRAQHMKSSCEVNYLAYITHSLNLCLL